MTITARPTHDHDAGLDHNHGWATDRHVSPHRSPAVANAAAVPTPSSAIHDDAHYAF